MKRISKMKPGCDLNSDSLIKMYEGSFKKNWSHRALSDFRGGDMSYGELATQIAKVHLILKGAGIKKSDKVAICGKNCMSWGATFFSVLTYGAVPVPILNDFKPGNIHTIVNHSEAKILFAGDLVMNGMVPEEMPNILGMILMNDFSCTYSRSEELNSIMASYEADFAKLYPNGYTKEDIKYDVEEDMNALAVLNYTSGTTSDPKGVMIPYRALLINMKFACSHLPLQPGHSVVSILPMAHMFGLAFQLMFELLLGASVCYLVKMPTPKILFDAFAEYKPELVITVPLIIEKAIKQKVMPVLSKPIMKFAFSIPGVSTIIGNKIKKKLLQAFGGQVDSVIIGGAALNADVERVLNKLKFPYTVGYGSTECAPLISYSDWQKYKPGSCGVAIEGTQVDVFSEDKTKDVGELLVKGDNVMLGYYKNPNATRDVIDPEGWYHTGDMGLVDKAGNIFIKGRSKNMILGASGQNIYPEELEDMINNLPYVEESLVVGRGTRLVALVLPNYEAGCQDGLTDEQVLTSLEEGKKHVNSLLPSYSQIAEFEIRTEPFERTPKRSIRRFLYK